MAGSIRFRGGSAAVPAEDLLGRAIRGSYGNGLISVMERLVVVRGVIDRGMHYDRKRESALSAGYYAPAREQITRAELTLTGLQLKEATASHSRLVVALTGAVRRNLAHRVARAKTELLAMSRSD